MNLEHHYALRIEWTGNRGTGTATTAPTAATTWFTQSGKPSIEGSSDRAFHGDAERWNPEELLLAALSQCHMLSYLHVARPHGIVVVGYHDAAVGSLEQTAGGGGRFTEAVLRPVVTIASGDPGALDAHAEASRLCFIASSVNFPVRHAPELRVVSD